MEKKIRMADIAEKLGISVVSVSKALSGKDGVSEEMRERILELAKEMGYVPLRSKPQKENKPVESGNIGILVADRFFADSTFYSNLYRQLLMKCNDIGFSALLEIVSVEAERNCTLPAMVTGGKVDGIIFMGEISREYLKNVVQSGLPYMLLDFYDEALDADGVTSDNVTGGYSLAKHILESGRKEIGFVGSIHATSSIMDRFLGYTKAMLRAGEHVNMEWILEDRDFEGNFIPIQLPDRMPQAFICSCDEVAYNLVETLKKAGYRVPEDVAVAGYDDFQFAQICDPQLTTYRVNVEEMGMMVVKQMVYRIRGKHITRGNIVVKGDFVQRQST